MYIPKFLVIASVAAVLILGIAVVLLLLNKGDDEQARTLDSYYFEARLEVEESQGTRPVGRPTELRPISSSLGTRRPTNGVASSPFPTLDNATLAR